MTQLTKPIRRVTRKTYKGRPVVVTLAPADKDGLIGLHLLGTRTRYIVSLSDLYRIAAMWHGTKVAQAKKEARRNGVPWNIAKKTFLRNNSI